MAGRDPDAISPTAQYTGEVWRRNGLGDEALGTWQGRALHAAGRPLFALSRALGGDTLEDFLLARHHLIDSLLADAIAAGRIGQVVEIAAGMSPRGLLLSRANPELEYVEGDLPAMAARKRAALRGARPDAGTAHRIADLDAFATAGPDSLEALCEGLDPDDGLAIVTEGLLNYFPREAIEGLWRRIAATLGRFAEGLYLSDIHLGAETAGPLGRGFAAALGVFVRGRIHVHYDAEEDAIGALGAAGFGSIRLHQGSEISAARGARRVHVIEAVTETG